MYYASVAIHRQLGYHISTSMHAQRQYICLNMVYNTLGNLPPKLLAANHIMHVCLIIIIIYNINTVCLLYPPSIIKLLPLPLSMQNNYGMKSVRAGVN